MGEHLEAYLKRDVERERRRGDFLLQAVEQYAPHVINDLSRTLSAEYPRACVGPKANENDD